MGVTTTPTADLLQAEALVRTFIMGTTPVSVLRDTSLSVKQGEFIAIEGRSGSGKSTLLHILAGLDAPDAGRVIFDGTDIAALSMRSRQHSSKFIPARLPGRALFNVFFDKSDLRLAKLRSESFGFVFQFYHLLPELNVLENTLLTAMVRHTSFGFRSNARELNDRAADLLNSFGLGARLRHPANRLSGGERQRVAIARALMNKPRVLFADEPTGNLDADTGRQIMGVLENLHQNQGQTIVMVTHDRTLARRADRVMVLQGGTLSTAT